MTAITTDTPQPALTSIFHPTDLSRESQVAFVHALKLALAAGAELRIMHIGEDQGQPHWKHFPQVRATLAQWGLLPPGSAQAAVNRLGLRVRKIQARHKDPAESILRYLDLHHADLIVLATHQRHGLARWLYDAVAEPVARRAGVMTLFIPPRINGFVSPRDGAVRLQRILIPADQDPHPQAAVDAASALVRTLGSARVSFNLVHVEHGGAMPSLRLPSQQGWTWATTNRRGDVVHEILQVRAQCSADLIAMATQGHKGFLDAIRGSTTERVIQGAQCPVVAIPVELANRRD